MSTKLFRTIKEMKEKHGLVKLARKLRMTPMSITNFLNGGRVYDKTLNRLQKAAGLEITTTAKRPVAPKKDGKVAKKKSVKTAKKKPVKPAKKAEPNTAKAIASDAKRAKAKSKKLQRAAKVKTTIKRNAAGKVTVKEKPVKKPKAPKVKANGASAPAKHAPVEPDTFTQEDLDEVGASA